VPHNTVRIKHDDLVARKRKDRFMVLVPVFENGMNIRDGRDMRMKDEN
jgi:hypothetical protein